MRISIKFLYHFELRAKLFSVHWFTCCENIINLRLFKKLFIFLFRPMGLIYKSRIFLRNHFEWITFHMVYAIFKFRNFYVRGPELDIGDFFNFYRLECIWLLHVEETWILLLLLAFETFFFGIFQKAFDFLLKRSVRFFRDLWLVQSVVYKHFLLITKSFFVIFKLWGRHIVLNCLFLHRAQRFILKTFVVRIVVLRAVNIIVSERYQICFNFFWKIIVQLGVAIFEPSVFFFRGPRVFLA